MSWIQHDPWPAGSERLPGIALGRNHQTDPLPRSIFPHGPHTTYGGGSGGQIQVGNANISACIRDGYPDLVDITIVINPSSEEIDKYFRLLFDRVFINDTSLNKIQGYGSTYPFEIKDTSKNVFLISVNAGTIVDSWYSTQTVSVGLYLCYEGDYQDPLKVRYSLQTSFSKGPDSLPISLTVLNNSSVKITFSGLPGAKCSCFSDCLPSAGIDIICPNTDFDVIRKVIFDDTNITSFDFTLEDSLGNTNTISIYTVNNIKPLAPSLCVSYLPTRIVIVGIPLLSYTFENLISYITHFQIERYVGSENNRSILVDWHPINKRSSTPVSNHSSIAHDNRLITNVKHGYRVRYRGQYNDMTSWSDWNVIIPTEESEISVKDGGVY